MRILAGVLVATVSFTGAHLAREALGRGEEVPEDPWAPAPATAPITVLGYREVMADLLFVRMTGYFGGRQASADGVGKLTEAIIALDPKYKRAYDYGANAMTIASRGVNQDIYRRAVAILEKGVTQFPDDWKIPFLAGDIYTQDLQTNDPAQRRAWDERSTLLIESAIRRPGAPVSAATWAAFMRTKLGQRDRAISGLREMLLITTDKSARDRIIEKLAKLEDANSDEIAGEIFEERLKFDSVWQRDRPTIRSTMYVLLGPRIDPTFDMGDLATGGADIVGSAPIDKLEPLE